MTALSKTQQYLLEKAGLFPSRRVITNGGENRGGLCVWDLDSVIQWMNDRPLSVTEDTPCITIGGKPGRKLKIKEEINVTGGEL